MTPELRLVRYFVAVAQERHVTRAAERLHIAQPSLSAAIKQLEAQLGVGLLDRSTREVVLTPAGERLAELGPALLAHADELAAEVRRRGAAVAGRLEVGLSPTARYGLGPELLGACAAAAPGAMLYTREATTGALARDVARGRLDLAVLFCAPAALVARLRSLRLRDEPAVVHLPATHRLAGREAVSLADLAGETILVAADRDSGGFSDRVIGAFEAAGIAPQTLPDPYPDLGLQAVREGLGVVVYVRSAFPERLEGSAFVPIEPPLALPFDLAWRPGEPGPALAAVIAIARHVASSRTGPASERTHQMLFGPEHTKRYLETDGEEGHEWQGTVCLLLFTKGRKSGEERIAPLIYQPYEDAHLVVASKGGAPEPPAWYVNLHANPDDVEIQIKGDRFKVRVRDASAEEKPDMWKTMTAVWPQYDEYQTKTDREIPVVVLERA